VEPASKAVRTLLFELSGTRAYPQVFVREADGSYSCIGDFDAVQALNDTDSLPPEVLAANPSVSWHEPIEAASARFHKNHKAVEVEI
jgi:hypothetical protein